MIWKEGKNPLPTEGAEIMIEFLIGTLELIAKVFVAGGVILAVVALAFEPLKR